MLWAGWYESHLYARYRRLQSYYELCKALGHLRKEGGLKCVLFGEAWRPNVWGRGPILARKPVGRWEECNSLLCFTSDAFSSCRIRLRIDTTLMKKSSQKLMYSEVQQLFHGGYYLSFQNKAIKTQIICPSLGNCPLFYSHQAFCMLAQGYYRNIVPAGLQTTSSCS